MYKVIKNGEYLAEWFKSLPQEAGIFERNEAIRKRLIQSVQCMDLHYDMMRDLEADLGVFLVILYGSSCEVTEHFENIMNYFKLDESDFEYEDRYKPERSMTVTFRLYLCSSDYGVEIVAIKNQAESLEARLKEGDWWQENNECICLQDITKPPSYFDGTQRQWIEEITAYQYSHPKEWQELYKEYRHRTEMAGNLDKIDIGFHRSEDGYLRKDGERDIYLKIKGIEPLDYNELDEIGEALYKQADELFTSYLEYCQMSRQKRTDWIKQIKDKIGGWTHNNAIIVTSAETLDESAFAKDELYYDILNQLHIIL